MVSPALNGLPLGTSSVLGVTPTIAPLVAPLGQTTMSPLAGLPGSVLSAPPVTVPGFDSIGVPTECLLLKNMFDPNSEVCCASSLNWLYFHDSFHAFF